MRRVDGVRWSTVLALMVAGAYVVIAVCAPLLANARAHLALGLDGMMRAPVLAGLGRVDWVLLVLLGQGATLAWSARDGRKAGVGSMVLLWVWGLWPVAVWWMSGRADVRAPLPVLAGGLGVVLPVFALGGLARGLWLMKQAEGGPMRMTQGGVVSVVLACGMGIAGGCVAGADGQGSCEDDAGAIGWSLPAAVAHDQLKADANARALPPGGVGFRVWRTDAMGALRRCESLDDDRAVVMIPAEDVSIDRANEDDPYAAPGRIVMITMDLERRVAHVPAGGDAYDLARAVLDETEGAVGAAVTEAGGLKLTDRTGPGRWFWLGTDAYGSDVAARLIHGARTSLAVGVGATVLAVLAGALIGAIMAAAGGWIDGLGLRLIEVVQAVPRVFLLLIALAFIEPEHDALMMLVLIIMIGATSWTTPARLMRMELQRVRELSFVEAARAAGIGRVRILLRHMIPHGAGPVLVDASFAVAAAMLLETSLSFLGFGVRPPQASWGGMLAGAVDPATGAIRWWLAVGPGAALCGLVFCLNVAGDALRRSSAPPEQAGV
jgi:ABC-type dipeptide/oligopeptide/nickel transport system permease subunit